MLKVAGLVNYVIVDWVTSGLLSMYVMYDVLRRNSESLNSILSHLFTDPHALEIIPGILKKQTSYKQWVLIEFETELK